MRVLVLAVLLCSLALGDLEHKGESRVYLSEGVGNRLVVHRVRPTCPDDACSQCEAAELVLKLVINKNGTVKQITVVRAGDSRLAGAALDAVRQWRYGRYTLNGSPVEYETSTTIKSWMCGGLILPIAKTPGNACDLRPEREAVPAVEISSGQPVTSSFPTALRNRLKRKLLIEPWLLAPLANGVEDAF